MNGLKAVSLENGSMGKVMDMIMGMVEHEDRYVGVGMV